MIAFDKHIIVESVFDNIAVTTRSAEYLELFRTMNFPKPTEASIQRLNAIQQACNESVSECNRILKYIGGIPVRAGLDTENEYSATIHAVTGQANGKWFFEAQTLEDNSITQLSGTVERFMRAYRATLQPSSDYLTRQYL